MSPASYAYIWHRKTFPKLNGVVLSTISPSSHTLYSPQIGWNFNHYLAKQSLNWQNFKMVARSFIDSGYELFFFSGLLNLKFCQQPYTNVLFCSKVGIIRNEIYFFWFLSMCKLRRITHKFNIKPSGLYSICEWFAGVYTSIKPKK